MNDIKKKKQEVVAKMQPVWDEEYRKKEEFYKKIRQEKKNQLKCFWTYPWGHIFEGEWKRDDFRLLYKDCLVCNKRIRP